MKPIIGIVARTTSDSDHDNLVGMFEKIRIGVIKKGGIPLLITPPQLLEYENVRPKEVPRLTSEEQSDLKVLIDLCDGIIFPGGYKWYEYDEFVYDHAYHKKMPILGICAGMQMIGKMDVIKDDYALDITVKNETKLNHHQRERDYVHNVHILEHTLLRKIVGSETIKVNSRHNYHINNVNDFIVSAYSDDGLIEAIEDPHVDQFVLGVQWHPETMIDYDENANKIFDYFMNETLNKK